MTCEYTAIMHTIARPVESTKPFLYTTVESRGFTSLDIDEL